MITFCIYINFLLFSSNRFNLGLLNWFRRTCFQLNNYVKRSLLKLFKGKRFFGQRYLLMIAILISPSNLGKIESYKSSIFNYKSINHNQSLLNLFNCLINAFTVSRGVIVGSDTREDLDTTQLTLRLTKLIRATIGEEQRDKTDISDQDEYYR